jgi:hypothetical protein
MILVATASQSNLNDNKESKGSFCKAMNMGGHRGGMDRSATDSCVGSRHVSGRV